MARGVICLVAVLDCFTRRILAWRVSITLERDFVTIDSKRSSNDRCMKTVKAAPARHGTPEILNREQDHAMGPSGHPRSGQPVHLDRVHQGAGRPQDQDQHGWQGRMARQCFRRAPVADHQIQKNRPAGLSSVSRARPAIGQYPGFYNSRRPYSSRDGQIPDQACFNQPIPKAAAA